MKFKGYILTVIMAGLALGPIGVHADEVAVAVPSLTDKQELETQNTQQVDNDISTSSVKELSTLQRVGLCAAIPVVAGLMFAAPYAMTYLVNRSVSVAHEGGHALAAWLVGKKITTFHVSAAFNGGGVLQYAPKEVGLKEVFLVLAGPLGGAAAYFAWGKLIEAASYAIDGDEHKETNILAKLTGFTFGSLGALIQLDNLTPSKHLLGASYGPCAGKTLLSDGGQIQQNLAAIAPVLGMAYPYIARAGLMAFVGYSAYRIYQMFNELRKEFNHQGKVNHEA